MASSTFVSHFDDDWGEAVIFISIGCFVRERRSVDQQFPTCFHPFMHGTSKKGGLKVLLFDPDLRRRTPMCVSVNEPEKWVCKDEVVFTRNQVKLITSNSYFDAKASFLPDLERYLLDSVLNRGALLLFAIFTQPYCCVEENHDAIDFYHRLLHNPQISERFLQSKIQYFHLAEYGSRSKGEETIVWGLNGRDHDQDEAILREVCRYEGAGINFGVASYAQYPGKKFVVKVQEGEGVDYQALQSDVEEAAKQTTYHKGEEFLDEHEFYAREMLKNDVSLSTRARRLPFLSL